MFTKDDNKSQLSSPSEYLIIKNTQDGDYKINVIYFISKFVENRRLAIGIFLFFSIVLFLFVIYQKPQYQVRSYLVEPVGNHYNDFLNRKDHLQINKEIYNTFVNYLGDPVNINAFLNDSDLFQDKLNHEIPSTRIKELNQLVKKISTRKYSDSKIELTTLLPNLKKSIDLNKAYIAYTNKKVLEELSRERSAENLDEIHQLKEKTSGLRAVNSIAASPAYENQIQQLQLEINAKEAMKFNTSDILSYKLDGHLTIEAKTNTKAILLLGILINTMLTVLFIVSQCNIIDLKRYK